MLDKGKIPFYTKPFFLNLLFFSFVSLLLLERTLVYLNVGIVHIDSDQPFLWIGTSDYAKGIFNEPRFYGQDYNTFMESLLAIPFIWLGVPVYYALPLATELIFLFPVLFPAFYLFAKGKKPAAILVLSIFLCLPLGYGILTAIPRGLITGIFFTGLFIVSILNPNDLKFIILNTLLCVVGYFVNPNIVIVSLPFCFYIFLHNNRDKKYYVAMFVCALSFVPLDWFFNGFYTRHPDYVVYGLEYAIGPQYFQRTFSRLNEVFGHVTFFIENCSLSLLTVLTVLGFALFRHAKKAFYTFLLFTIFIVFTFFMSKVWDGSTWPFYSYSRIYLGVPVLIALLMALLPIRSNRVFIIFSVATLIFSSYKLIRTKKDIAFHVQQSHWTGVHLATLETALNAMNFYKEVCKKQDVDHLFISNGFYLCTYLNYGGPAIYTDFPKTQESNSERRYWVREENSRNVIPAFVFISTNYDLHTVIDTSNFKMERLDHYGTYLIKHNKLNTDSFFTLTKRFE